jgi:signal transduction histidine kinase
MKQFFKLIDGSNIFLEIEWIIFFWYLLLIFLTWTLNIYPKYILFNTLISCVILGLMGLKLPKIHSSKIIYTISEFVILCLPFIFKDMLSYPMLFLIVVFRANQMFTRRICLLIYSLIAICLVSCLQYTNGFFNVISKNIKNYSTDQSGFHIDINNLYQIYILAFLSLICCLIFMLTRSISNLYKEKIRITNAMNKLEEYAEKIEEQTAILERSRIAIDLHDVLGHNLTILSIQLNSGLVHLRCNELDKAINIVNLCHQLSLDSLKEIRWTLANYKNTEIRVNALEKDLRNLILNLQSSTNIKIKFNIFITNPISNKISNTIYRLVQEALTNIVRHSQASFVCIDINNIDNALKISIQDNGKGFDLGKKYFMLRIDWNARTCCCT